MVERALQEMKTLVRAIQEELAQAQEKKKNEQEEECRKKQADMKAQQEEQMKTAALSVKKRATKQGKSSIHRIFSEFRSVEPTERLKSMLESSELLLRNS